MMFAKSNHCWDRKQQSQGGASALEPEGQHYLESLFAGLPASSLVPFKSILLNTKV